MGIAAIESALLAAIEARLGSTITKSESIGGAWSFDALSRALQFAPGVYVAFLGGKVGSVPGYLDTTFAVYCVSKGPIDGQRRAGNARVIGAYDMLERLLPVLDGLRIEDLGSVSLESVDNLFTEAMFELGGTVYGIRLSVPSMPLPDPVDLDDLDNFERFEMQMDIKPKNSLAEIAKWLHEPADHSTSAPEAEGFAGTPLPE